MSDDCCLVNIEVFGQLSSRFSRIIFNQWLQKVVVNIRGQSTTFSILKWFVTNSKFCKSKLNCSFRHSGFSKSKIYATSSFSSFFPNLNSYKKIVRNCRLSMMTLGCLKMTKKWCLNKTYILMNRGKYSLLMIKALYFWVLFIIIIISLKVSKSKTARTFAST